MDVGVGTFDGLTERNPEPFGIILRKSLKQIVKRFHPRPAAGFPSLRPKFPPRICCGGLVQIELHRLWIMLIQYGRKMTGAKRRNAYCMPIVVSCAAIVDPLGLASHIGPSEATIWSGLWRKQGAVVTTLKLTRQAALSRALHMRGQRRHAFDQRVRILGIEREQLALWCELRNQRGTTDIDSRALLGFEIP
jgi:hypothetical protein